jgi:hypothetical protein
VAGRGVEQRARAGARATQQAVERGLRRGPDVVVDDDIDVCGFRRERRRGSGSAAEVAEVGEGLRHAWLLLPECAVEREKGACLRARGTESEREERRVEFFFSFFFFALPTSLKKKKKFD